MEASNDKREINDSENPEDSTKCRRKSVSNCIEVTVALVFFAYALGATATGNLILYRTCVLSLRHDAKDCRSFLSPEAFNHTQELEKAVQEYAAFVGTVKSVLEALGPAVLSLFFGSWSDRHGRKPLLVWPLLGMTLASMLTVVYSMVEGLNPWWITVTSLPYSLSGSYCAMLIGTMCYVSDISSVKRKAVSFVIIQAVIALSLALGGLSSSYVLKAVGTVYLLLIQATLFAIAYAFTNVFIEESMREAEQGTILTMFDLSHAKEMARTCFKVQPNYGRANLLLPMTACTISVFVVSGTSGLLYMYTRTKIQWSMKDFTTFSSVSQTIWFAGSVLGVAVVQKTLRISDLNFVAISYFSCVVEYLIKAFATETWHMYLGSTIAIFSSISGPLTQSFLAKTVSEADVAKVFGLLGSAGSIAPLLAPLLFNAIYAATVFSFPASVMLLHAFMSLICLTLVGIVQCLRTMHSSGAYQTVES